MREEELRKKKENASFTRRNKSMNPHQHDPSVLPLVVWELVAAHCRPKDAISLSQCCRSLRPLISRFHSAEYVASKPIDAESTIHVLSRFVGIRNLSIVSVKYDARDAASLAALTNLRLLDVNEDDIGEAGAASLAALTDLTSLDVRFNHIGADGAASIASGLTNLTTLKTSDNGIGASGAASLASRSVTAASVQPALQASRL